MQGPIDFKVGDIVEMRKPHPCGSYEWRVLRIGMDIGAECMQCGRYILIPRRKFESRIKRFLARGDSTLSLTVEGE